MTNPTAVIVDDHPVFRHGLATLLAEEQVTVLEAVGTAAAALDAVTAHSPDVVVMDLHLPDASGIEATRRILLAAPETKVLALTMDRSESTVLAALRAGARGYLLKDAAAESIGGAIATLMRGELVLDTHFARRLATLLTPPADPSPGLEQLTHRELEIVALIAQGHSNAEIGRRLFLAEKTVRNNVTVILSKTGAGSRARLIDHETARPNP